MTRRLTHMLAAAFLIAIPALSEAGPPLICHPFQTAGGELLPWGTGSSWNNPDGRYEVQRLTGDVLRLLTPEAPVLTRMENLRRAAIYAAQNKPAADQLLQALLVRASSGSTGAAHAAALFDAGYLVEAYKQSTHMHHRPAPAEDGYAMTVRAIAAAGGDATMEFAASLMTSGAQADAHVRRARAAAASQPLLAQNIENLWR